MKKDIVKKIEIPHGIEIKLEGGSVNVKGSLGENSSFFKLAGKIKVEKKDNLIEISCRNATKREKKLIGSIKSRIENMIMGVSKKFIYKLQICAIHFPMTIKIEKNKFIIKNFLGESKDRVIRVTPGVDIELEKDLVMVSSTSKEKAGQMAADIETLTKVRRYDRRVFQDGIWIIKKEKGKVK